MGTNKVCLIILDGFGYAPTWGGNAVSMARMPNWKKWWTAYPHSLLVAHGKEVGLPEDKIGNSEVGHLTIGAGRVVPQDSTRINQAIEDKSFFSNPALVDAFENSKRTDRPIHLMGLLSDGGVHASYNHLEALIKMARMQHIAEVKLHLFLDGRDTDTHHSIELVDKLNHLINLPSDDDENKTKIEIATISGRYYGMDRDRHFERTKVAVDAMILGKGDLSNDPMKGISANYARGKSDEFIPPVIIVHDDRTAKGLIKDRDSVIFFNYRGDRMRQICELLTQMLPKIKLITFIPCGFEKDLQGGLKAEPAFPPLPIKNGLTQYLSDNNKVQVHIAETEKYAHVTYFFNSGVEQAYKFEDRILVPSPRIATYDLMPMMSADRVCEKIISSMRNNNIDFIVGNFANADMVGHTGDFNASIGALEDIDQLLGKIYQAIGSKWNIIITADHGNIEEMLDPVTGEINTEHTKNPVPFSVITPDDCEHYNLVSRGVLSDVAPTILDIMGLPKPVEMTGKSLIEK